MITSFDGQYDFLSNFHPANVVLDGMTFPTVEHAFQAAKTHYPQERLAIQKAETPGKAKRIGRTITLRPDWDSIRESIMRSLLLQKFSDADLRKMLLDTGDQELIEGNTWGDRYWGAVFEHGRWVGENRLGYLLTEVRSALRASTLNVGNGTSSASQSDAQI